MFLTDINIDMYATILYSNTYSRIFVHTQCRVRDDSDEHYIANTGADVNCTVRRCQ